MVHIDRLWLLVGSSPIRLSTVITFVAVLIWVTWRFRRMGQATALYNGIVAALFTFFVYEIIFNVTGKFPPTDALPPVGVGLMLVAIVLGMVQARRHFQFTKLSTVLLSVFVLDWLVWILARFPFNLVATQPLNLGAEAFNVTTKLLLPTGYLLGLAALREVRSNRDIAS